MKKIKNITGFISTLLLAFGLLLGPLALSVSSSEVAFAASGTSIQTLDENGNPKKQEDQAKEAKSKGQTANMGQYMGIDVGRIFSPDGDSEGGLWGGLVGFLQILVNAILLPIAIIYNTWRCLYLAVFCYIAHSDPLNMLSDARYAEDKGKKHYERKHGTISFNALNNFTQAPSAAQHEAYERAGMMSPLWRNHSNRNMAGWEEAMNQNTRRCLFIELKHMGIGLFIVFAIWALLNAGMWIAIVLLQLFGGFG